MTSVLIELEKLRNPNSGLGQFCMHLGQALVRANEDGMFRFQHFLPANQFGVFGDRELYVACSPLHKFFSPAHVSPDIWHCTHQDSKYLPSRKKTRLLVTVHDMNYLYKYAGMKRRYRTRVLQRLVDRADSLAVISQFTRSELENNIRLGGKPVSVIHNGNTLRPHLQATRPAGLPQGKFIFSIGIILPRKNFHVLVPALQRLGDYSLVIAGDDTHAYAQMIREQAQQMGVGDRVVLLGGVTEAEKLWLYTHCEGLAFPSLAEGFGLPVVEAMSLGKPVFLSRSASLPEIGGPEACYFDSFDPEDMADVIAGGLRAYAADPGKRLRILSWAGRFSWDAAAKAYLEVYRTLS